jgi:predicted metal-dependent HD superfamily phosphohydrolase
VPRRSYRSARTRILRSFLDRRAIFNWPQLRERYEAQARANLLRAIEALNT